VAPPALYSAQVGETSRGGNSYAPLLIEIGLWVQGRMIPLAAHEFLQGFEIEVSTDNFLRGKIRLWDQQGDYLENLFLAAGSQRGLYLRWDWDSTFTRPSVPMFFFIVNYQPEVKPTGTAIQCDIVTTDAMSSIQPVPIEIPRGMLIGAAMELLAKKYGYRTRRANFPQGSTIQPTRNAIADGYAFSKGETLVEVFRRLASLALDERGEGGFRVYQDHAGVLHFHTAFYAPSISARYIYGTDPNGEVISFEMADNTIDAAFIGAGDAIHEAVDGYSGTATQLIGTSSALGGKRGIRVEGEGGVLPRPPAEYTKKVEASAQRLSSETGALVQSAETDPDTWIAKMRYRRNRLFELSYTANMVVLGTHTIDPYDRITVEVRYRGGQLHPISGLFLVNRINQRVGDGSGWRTELGLTKMTRSMAVMDTEKNILRVDAEATIRAIEAYSQAMIPVTVRKG